MPSSMFSDRKGKRPTTTKTIPTILFCIFVFLLTSGELVAQTQTAVGTPAFGSYTSGSDVINLGNLNMHFTIPIRHKSGRGKDFNYDLTYDSSVWYPASVSGALYWQPVASSSLPGWQGLANAGQSYVTYSISSSPFSCFDGRQWNYFTTYTYGGFYYVDQTGTGHGFPVGWSYIAHTGGSAYCGPNPGYSPSSATQTQLATDSSGYTITVTPTCCTASAVPTIGDKQGRTITPPVIINPNWGTQYSVDRNGNEITTVNGTYTDTLGQVALSVVGAPPSNTTNCPSTQPCTTNLSYTAPSGATATFVVKYVSFTVQTHFQCSNVYDYGPSQQNLVTEIDLPDVGTNPSSKYLFAYEQTPGAPNSVTARIASITLPTGGTISYTYTGANDGISCTDGSTNGLTRTLNTGAEWQYSRSGSGSSWTTTAIDPSSNRTVMNFQMASSGNSDYYYETERQIYQGTGTLLETLIRCYNGNYASCPTASVSATITQTDTYRQTPSGTTALSEVIWDSYGLPTSDKEYDFGVNLGSAPSSSYLLQQTISPTIAINPNGDHVPDDVYSSITVKDGTGNTLSKTTYSYDQLAPQTSSGTPQHLTGTNYGNLTTVATQANSGTTLYQQYGYYDTGMVANSLSANTSSSATCASNPSICTTYTYGSGSCGNAFPTSISEPMSLSRSMAYNCLGGTATSITDENGKTATVTYSDPYFWRPASTADAMSNVTNLTYTPTTVESALNFASSTSDQLTTVDAFGRASLVQTKQGPGAVTFDSTQTAYGWNGIGAYTTKSVPYAGSSGQGAPGGTAVTTTQYDALGRVASVTDGAGGTVTYTYTNQDVLQSVQGVQTFKKQFEYDALGRLISVCEMTTAAGSGTCGQSSPQTGYWTKYSYDAAGHLLTVTQNAQGSSQTRTFAYDMLGRMTSETNPETGNGAPGITYYYYDAAYGSYAASPGDLTKKADPAGHVTYYGYDALHRLTDAGNNGPTCRHYRYDSQTPPTGVSVSNTKARITETYTDSCGGSKTTDEWFGYDADGNNTDFYESTPHSGGYYHSQADYWANGSLNALSLLNASAGSIIPTIYYGANNGSGLDGEGRVTQ